MPITQDGKDASGRAACLGWPWAGATRRLRLVHPWWGWRQTGNAGSRDGAAVSFVGFEPGLSSRGARTERLLVGKGTGTLEWQQRVGRVSSPRWAADIQPVFYAGCVAIEALRQQYPETGHWPRDDAGSSTTGM